MAPSFSRRPSLIVAYTSHPLPLSPSFSLEYSLDALQVRAKKSKFVCINDDMKTDAPEVVAMLADFYEAMLPIPSPFELAGGYVNRFLRVDEYRVAVRRARWNLALLVAASAIALLLLAVGVDEACLGGRGSSALRLRCAARRAPRAAPATKRAEEKQHE